MNKLKVCICGGGNIAHVLVGLLGGKDNLEIRLLTRKPAQWRDALRDSIRVVDEDGSISKGYPKIVSNRPESVIPDADVIFLALPGFARSEVLSQIADYISEDTCIGSFPGIGGFDWMAAQCLDIEGKNITVFGSQRVPYIARIIQYGKEVFGSLKKEGITVAVRPKKQLETICSLLESILDMKVRGLDNFMEITLATSNPILHPARMYTLFRDYEIGMTWDRQILFYEKWDTASSDMLVSMDEEVHQVIDQIPLNLSGILPLLEHYGVTDATTLTKKISNIPAFKGITTPMLESNAGFRPDPESRYFTEDIPYGLLIIKGVAAMAEVQTPAIDSVLNWAQEMMGKRYLIGGTLTGKDIEETPIPQNMGMSSIDDLVQCAI